MSAARPSRRENAGPEAAATLEDLYREHHASLWRLALRMAGDAAAAEDLVQETFVRALRRPLPGDLRSAEAWMVRTLVNLCRDRHRWQKVRDTHAERTRAGGPPPAAAAGDSERQAVDRLAVDRALRALPVRRRAVLVLRELEGLDEKQVASLMGLRPSTVRWHLMQARREMRTLLAGEETA